MTKFLVFHYMYPKNHKSKNTEKITADAPITVIFGKSHHYKSVMDRKYSCKLIFSGSI